MVRLVPDFEGTLDAVWSGEACRGWIRVGGRNDVCVWGGGVFVAQSEAANRPQEA
jgi:hypothetical protein